MVSGVNDNGRDPAVVALDVGADSLCSGTLIAPDVLLTARHCVSITADTIACPATGPQVTGERPPSSLRVLSGDKVQTAREVARGTAVVLPPATSSATRTSHWSSSTRPSTSTRCDVSTTGVTAGNHVTSVGYGRKADGNPPGTKLFREHVEVLSTTAWEFLVGEATCQGDSGGPALDETTGDIVGIVSRGGPTCDGPGAHNVYTRTDAFQSLINEALSMSVYQTESATDDGGVTDAGKKKKKKPDGGRASLRATWATPARAPRTAARGLRDGSGDAVLLAGLRHGQSLPGPLPLHGNELDAEGLLAGAVTSRTRALRRSAPIAKRLRCG